MSRRGRDMARRFREIRGISQDGRRCDLAPILAEDNISLAESFLAEPGYTACLVTLEPVGRGPAARRSGGILLAPGQIRGRQRFSIAHELGHFHLPWHQARPDGWCGEDAMAARADSPQHLEWEANDFAAELLMPWRLFSRDAGRVDPSIAAITELASPDNYDVSVTAAALRFVEVTAEDCALVCSKDGTIEWAARSRTFPYRIPWKGDRLPRGSIGKATGQGECSDGSAELVDPYVWLEKVQHHRVEVRESAHPIPSQSQVLSLIWTVSER
jgi:hypothetical protein